MKTALPQTHYLKTRPEFYADICEGRKTFEVRKDDRGFVVGDILVLQEWVTQPGGLMSHYSDNELSVIVTYKLPGGKFGIEPNSCILGIKPIATEEQSS